MVHNAGRGRDDIKIIFPFQALQNDLHVKEPQKPAAKAETQCQRGLRFIRKARIGELELLQRVLQIRVLRRILRI